MKTSLRVRILLLLLIVAFTGTAIFVSSFYDRQEVLLLEGEKIEKNLHKKEAEVQSLLTDSAFFNALKNVNNRDSFAKKIIEEYGEKKQIYIYTYSNNELDFWGSSAIVPKTDVGISAGSSLITWDNGWYEAFKKTEDGFSVLFLIPIKRNFPLSNRYLKNIFSKDLIKNSNLDIASFKDKEVYNLRNSEGKYLLSLKISPQFRSYFSTFVFILWMLAFVSCTIFITVICQWIAEKGWIKLSILFLVLFFIVARYVDLSSQFSAINFYGGVFDPTTYASSFISPSLGALFLNTISLTWIMAYTFSYRFKLQVTRKNISRFQSVVLFTLFGVFIYLFSVSIVTTFRGLISNSSINFDVTNILNLSLYSWIGITTLCFMLLNLYLFIETLYIISLGLRISYPLKKKLFLLFLFLAFLTQLYLGTLSVSFFILSFILFLRFWVANKKGEFKLAMYVVILLSFAAIASLKQNTFQRDKMHAKQLAALQKLESADDPNAVLFFMDIEKKIPKSNAILSQIDYAQLSGLNELNESIRKDYFSGYLSRYEFNGYLFDHQLLSSDSTAMKKLSYFKNKVIEGSRKVSDNFYRLNEGSGNLSYFGLLPIKEDGQGVGLYLVELNNASLKRYGFFPEILVDGNMDISNEIETYSYAFYKGGSLQNQKGEYLYPQTDKRFPQETQKYYNIEGKDGFIHILYKPNERDTIILSSKDQRWWLHLGSLSFLFLVFLVFVILVYILQWLFVILRDYDFNFRNLRWSIMISQNRILYSTRIQAIVVSAVVFTLVIAGVITYFNLSIQNRKQQVDASVIQVNQVGQALEAKMFKEGKLKKYFLNEDEFSLISETNAADFNLYGADGELIYSTQSKIYDLGLTSRFIHSEAWLNLHGYRKDEYFQHERIGDLNYLVSYTTLKDENRQVAAYLSLPYFSNQKVLNAQVGLLLNTLINIYAFVIVALGLFAAVVANYITAPLSMVQRSLARTTIGRKNEPIFWKRNDEIGSLIKEYNNMIIALDHSANQIMQSERESAWREMAMQVAHEIKNPLTPLLLGVQLLNRSWKEKDPDFEEKFERFSISFIEQIESLSRIASEFSSFASMPASVMENVDVVDVIEHAASIHSENKKVIVSINNLSAGPVIVLGDRDQLLRCFNNLLKNGIEARQKDRQMTINIQIELLGSDEVSIQIKDNGKGIDKSVRARIFQPNFTTKSSGTGLGLAIVKQTIEVFGGKIIFKTKALVGTTFKITLPLIKTTGN